MNERILVVDENTRNIQAAANILRPVGFNIAYAKTAEKLLEKCSKVQFSLILLDISLSGTDVFELLESIRQSACNTITSVLFMVEKKDQRNISRIFEMGAAGYVRKPLDNSELLAVVNRQVSTDNNDSALYNAKKKQEILTKVTHDSLLKLDKVLQHSASLTVNDKQSETLWPLNREVFFARLNMLNVFIAATCEHSIQEESTSVESLFKKLDAICANLKLNSCTRILNYTGINDLQIGGSPEFWETVFLNLMAVVLQKDKGLSGFLVEVDTSIRKFSVHIETENYTKKTTGSANCLFDIPVFLTDSHNNNETDFQFLEQLLVVVGVEYKIDPHQITIGPCKIL